MRLLGGKDGEGGNSHLLGSIRWSPGTVQRALCMQSLALSSDVSDVVVIMLQCSGKRSSERVGNLPKATQLDLGIKTKL